MTALRSQPDLLTERELASIRREYGGASLLPKRAYLDADIFS